MKDDKGYPTCMVFTWKRQYFSAILEARPCSTSWARFFHMVSKAGISRFLSISSSNSWAIHASSPSLISMRVLPNLLGLRLIRFPIPWKKRCFPNLRGKNVATWDLRGQGTWSITSLPESFGIRAEMGSNKSSSRLFMSCCISSVKVAAKPFKCKERIQRTDTQQYPMWA